MSETFSSFGRFRLNTKFGDGYCEHTHSTTTPKADSTGRTETWTRVTTLGQGACGTVWLEREEGGALRAVKMIPKIKIRNSRELLALTELSTYPRYFVQFLGWFESEMSLYLAIEYMEYGDLETFILNNNVPENDLKTVTRQLLEGLKIMHGNNFSHRDLKPQNILIASLSPLGVKIGDFGISKQVDDSTALLTVVGTPGYMAPEVWGYISSETSVYTNAVDMWSLGCVIYAMITRETPFQDTGNLLNYIQSRISFPKTKLLEGKASSDAIKFLVSLMRPHPEDRLTAEEALKHMWLNAEEVEETQIDPRSGLLYEHMCTTMYCAVYHGNLSALELLCQQDGVDVNARQIGGTTLLHVAVGSGSCTEEMVQLLLEEGANVTAKNSDKDTALHLVAKMGNEAVAKLLLKKGAKIEERNAVLQTPLHLAAREGHYGMVNLLLWGEADYMATDMNGAIAMELALENGYNKVSGLLYEKESFQMVLGNNLTTTGLRHQRYMYCRFWGDLVRMEGKPVPSERLSHLLRGIGNYLIKRDPVNESLVITPQKMVDFYGCHPVRREPADWKYFFGEHKLSSFYKEWGCEHFLVPQFGFRYDTPVLTLSGFETWMFKQLMCNPDREIRRLQNILSVWPINVSEEGRRYPKVLPRCAFPEKGDEHISAEWDSHMKDSLSFPMLFGSNYGSVVSI